MRECLLLLPSRDSGRDVCFVERATDMGPPQGQKDQHFRASLFIWLITWQAHVNIIRALFAKTATTPQPPLGRMPASFLAQLLGHSLLLTAQVESPGSPSWSFSLSGTRDLLHPSAIQLLFKLQHLCRPCDFPLTDLALSHFLASFSTVQAQNSCGPSLVSGKA